MVEQNKTEIDKREENLRKELKEIRMLKKGSFSLFYDKVRRGVLDISKEDVTQKEKVTKLKELLKKNLEDIEKTEQTEEQKGEQNQEQQKEEQNKKQK